MEAKKLIEVSLPLPEINDASAYDKMPGIGPHPKGIHHWWARLPLPSARAVLFASVVDDPSAHPDQFRSQGDQDQERERLFGILRRMMDKQLHKHPEAYAEARKEMEKHCEGRLPPFLDPFAGGGSIPLEAQRLGFQAFAADLNPIAVLLNMCNLEMIPKWLNRSPVNRSSRTEHLSSHRWNGSQGLAEDVQYYGNRVRESVKAELSELYPRVSMPSGKEADVIAWIWARTVPSPNPALQGARVPLMTTFWLSSKKGSLAWLSPVIDQKARKHRFEVLRGEPRDRGAVGRGTKAGKGANFTCLLSGAPITAEYIQEQARRGELGCELVAIVASEIRGKTYLPASENHEHIALAAKPRWFPEEPLSTHPQYMGAPRYGMKRVGDLFTLRQLTAMAVISDGIKSLVGKVREDGLAAGLSPHEASEYARAVATFLAFALDRCADFNNSLSTWLASGQQQKHLFTRQAIPMVWDFAEANLLGEKAISWRTAVGITAGAIESMSMGRGEVGQAAQRDATVQSEGARGVLISTDPPYYDNIPYSDLSDFFYVWLRRTIGELYPELFSTMLTPKNQELVASSIRHNGDLIAAKTHFEEGFRASFSALLRRMDRRFPLTVYYAFKQEDEAVADSSHDDGVVTNGVDKTTGWETLLQALLDSGFRITATWPVRASQAWRVRSMGANALASYVVLACRPRAGDAMVGIRKQFLAELKKELPAALRPLQLANIAPVDLAQCAIGPGMSVFSRYSKILEADGSSMTVRTALSLINQVLDEVLTEQEGDFEPESRWCVAWFQQFGFNEGPFGEAETLCKAKNVSVQGLAETGVLVAKGGKVRLVSREELAGEWDPAKDREATVWKTTQHLVHCLEKEGEQATGELMKKAGHRAEAARDLAYRLFSICERKGWSREALAYNTLVTAWPEVSKWSLSSRSGAVQEELGL